MLATALSTIMLLGAIGEGDHAPVFTLPDQAGNPVSLAAYLGQRVVVLYFYPKDDTAGCTAEAQGFRDTYQDFVAAGAVVLGVSSDPVASHASFAGKNKLPFPLLADVGESVRRLYGVPTTALFIPGRVTYVIDLEGKVRMVYDSLTDATGHVERALALVKGLAASR